MSDIKKMAELLRGGAKMLSLTCPECGSILFKINDDIICPKCNKKVVVVKESQETETISILLDQVEKTVFDKIAAIEKRFREENDPQEIEKLSKLLLVWLEILERINNIKRK